MGCRIQTIVLQLPLERYVLQFPLQESHYFSPCFSAPTSRLGKPSPSPSQSFKWRRRRQSWKVGFALDVGGGIADNGGGEERVEDGGGGGGERTPRLGRLVSAGGREILLKLNSARKNFPMKVFLLLLGFYTANALATILGQTGDWDVLVAGVVVAAIEAIGILMYRRNTPNTNQSTGGGKGGRFQNLVVMINYWKAGLCLGLFVDAFKLGS